MSKIIPGDIIFKGLVGSHAYGTNIGGSDEDYKGVYIQSPESILNNGYVPQVQINKDEIYYELRRFIELCITANPTILELLYLPEENVVFEHIIFKRVKLLRNKFLTKKCRHSFGGYARQQIKKASGLDKKMNWKNTWEEKKTPLDFCYVVNEFLEISVPFLEYIGRQTEFKAQHQTSYALKGLKSMKDTFLYYYDEFGTWATGICSEEANEVKVNLNIPRSVNPKGILHFNRNAYSVYCKKHKEYNEWLKNRNTQHYVDINEHGQKIDGKNMLHCIRLIEMGKEISEGKGFNLKRLNAQYLISIRKGKLNLKTLLKKAEHDLTIMDKNFNKSLLSDDVDKNLIWRLIKTLRKRYYEMKPSKIIENV